ncbi:MAG: hypothetical protein EXX96DRAFT_541397 [Benjaminiella poitrasii]|nr:MAG: hypothetical protein EXX96DRAFT_541397 [Benjaminiella poitrasii]
MYQTWNLQLLASKAEHANFIGEKRRRMFVEKLKETKGIKPLESSMPASKTVRVSKYSTCLQYVLERLETFFSFYGPKFAPFSMYAYQSKQRANEEIANMLLDGRSIGSWLTLVLSKISMIVAFYIDIKDINRLIVAGYIKSLCNLSQACVKTEENEI